MWVFGGVWEVGFCFIGWRGGGGGKDVCLCFWVLCFSYPHLCPTAAAAAFTAAAAVPAAVTVFRVFGGDRIKNLMVAFRVEDLPMESQMLTDALDTAQKRVESYFYDIRK